MIAAVRSAAKLAEMGLGGEGLRVVDGVDVMQPETLTAALFSGVQQVVLCVGPAQGDGSKDSRNNDPYDPAAVPAYFVDSVGVMNVVSAAERFLTQMAEMAILNSADVTPDMKWTGVSFGASTSCITPDANGIRMEGTLEQGVGHIHRSRDCVAEMRRLGKSERSDPDRDDSVGRRLRIGSRGSRRVDFFRQRRRTLTLYHAAERAAIVYSF